MELTKRKGKQGNKEKEGKCQSVDKQENKTFAKTKIQPSNIVNKSKNKTSGADMTKTHRDYSNMTGFDKELCMCQT